MTHFLEGRHDPRKSRQPTSKDLDLRLALQLRTYAF